MSRHHSQPHSFKTARFEAMEVRRLLSTVVVNTLADETVANSTTSLREAIQLAAGGDTVQFKAGLNGTITLGGGELVIDKNLTIAGPGAAKLIVSGNNASRVLSVEFGATVTLSGLTMTKGRAEFGGGIQNTGQLTLNQCVVSANTAAGANGTDENVNGHEASGGGIFNFGNLALTSTTISNNVAIGGSGGYGMGIGVGAPAYGGGIFNGGGGTVTLSHATSSNNKAIGGSGTDNGFAGSNGSIGQGGAIYSDGANVIAAEDTTFTGNSATGGKGTSGSADAGTGGDGSGGAIFATNGDLVLNNVTFTNNAATGGAGGDVLDFYVSLPGGWGAGGAIYTGSIAPTIVKCTFANNVAGGGGHGGSAGGGAIYAVSGLEVARCTFDSNKAIGTDADGVVLMPGGAAYGGAISISGGVLSVADSTLSRNSAVAGKGANANATRGAQQPAADGGDAVGGAIVTSAGSPNATITRSTIFGNTVTGGAGGWGYDDVIWPAGDGGDARGGGIDSAGGLSLTACTIAGNIATAGAKGAQGGGAVNGQSFGGGVNGEGQLVFANTLIATNAAGAGPDVSGSALSQGFNLIGKSNGSIGWIASDRKGTIASALDAKLGPLAANGGLTQTVALLPGSPALDAGKAFGLTSDQRGAARPLNLAAVANAAGGDGSDIGAFELQSLAGQSAFKPLVIGSAPLTMQAEDFDNGGDGVAYHDVDSANLGGAYRNTGVDLQPTSDAGGGVNVAWAKASEWLEYTLDVQSAGYYAVDFRVASKGAGGTFHLEVEGNDVTGPLTLPNTSGWQNWTTICKNGVYLYAGTNVLRLAMDSNGASGFVGNFNFLKISRGVVTANAAAAAHARDGSYAAVNYGVSPTLEVKKSTSGYNREGFLKFELGALDAVSSAKLRLFGKLADAAAPSIGVAVYSSSSTSWDESTLTWSNRPAVDGPALAGATVAGTTAKWYELDVTPYIKSKVMSGATSVTLVLRSTTSSSTLVQLNSNEAPSNQPQLVVTI